MTLFPRVREVMNQRGLDDVLLTGGGIIAPEDMESLEKLGVGKLFGPGTPTQEAIDYVNNWVKDHRQAE